MKMGLVGSIPIRFRSSASYQVLLGRRLTDSTVNKLTLFGRRGNAISVIAAGPASTEANGPTWMLVHGFPLDHRMWRNQLSGLTANARVLAIELGGFGASTLGVNAEYQLADLADDVEYVREHLAAGKSHPGTAVSPVVLCGLSMGGYIAFEYARKFPTRLAGLVLANTKPNADDEVTKQSRLKVAEQVLNEGTAELVRNMPAKLLALKANPTEQMRALVTEMISDSKPESVAAAHRAMASRQDSMSLLPDLELPTLVVAGAEDPLMTVEETRSWSERIPHAVFEVIEQAGHLTPLEQPERFNQRLQAWWERISESQV